MKTTGTNSKVKSDPESSTCGGRCWTWTWSKQNDLQMQLALDISYSRQTSYNFKSSTDNIKKLRHVTSSCIIRLQQIAKLLLTNLSSVVNLSFPTEPPGRCAATGGPAGPPGNGMWVKGPGILGAKTAAEKLVRHWSLC